MTYAGARGNTERKCPKSLALAPISSNSPPSTENSDRLETDQQTNAIELNIANALWTQEGFPFLTAFLETATNQYQANVNQADFATDAERPHRRSTTGWRKRRRTKSRISCPGQHHSQHPFGPGQRHIFPGRLDRDLCGDQYCHPAVPLLQR